MIVEHKCPIGIDTAPTLCSAGTCCVFRIERLRETLIEIANRASNMMDDDAADWMPSIYKLACEAVGENHWRLLKAAGYTEETMSVGFDPAEGVKR